MPLGSAGIDRMCLALRAYAAGDPLSIVNNLSDFIFSCIRAIGVIILGWGIVQVGMSVQSHDASQRTQGFLCLFGGLLIAFAKEIPGPDRCGIKNAFPIGTDWR